MQGLCEGLPLESLPVDGQRRKRGFSEKEVELDAFPVMESAKNPTGSLKLYNLPELSQLGKGRSGKILDTYADQSLGTFGP